MFVLIVGGSHSSGNPAKIAVAVLRHGTTFGGTDQVWDCPREGAVPISCKSSAFPVDLALQNLHQLFDIVDTLHLERFLHIEGL